MQKHTYLTIAKLFPAHSLTWQNADFDEIPLCTETAQSEESLPRFAEVLERFASFDAIWARSSDCLYFRIGNWTAEFYKFPKEIKRFLTAHFTATIYANTLKGKAFRTHMLYKAIHDRGGMNGATGRDFAVGFVVLLKKKQLNNMRRNHKRKANQKVVRNTFVLRKYTQMSRRKHSGISSYAVMKRRNHTTWVQHKNVKTKWAKNHEI